MAKLPGSLWVEGEQLHFVDQNGLEWYYTGFYHEPHTGGNILPGSIWMDTRDNLLHWISASQLEYKIDFIVGPYMPANSVPGSIWVENSRIAWLSKSIPPIKLIAHTDTAVGGHVDTHTDTAHTDAPHSDTAHNDAAGGGHVDYHYDIPHSDHTDQAHGDIPHSDKAGTTFTDHGDYNPPSNIYTAHIDGNYAHWDYTTAYWHQDISGPTWVVSNPGHLDASLHDDVQHGDSPPVSTHTDNPHVDSAAVGDHNDHTDSSHGDTPHRDTAHVDGGHTDTHGDGPGTAHTDTPTYIGP